MANLHLRFDEGRVGRAQASPSLLLYRSALIGDPAQKTVLDETGFLMEAFTRPPSGDARHGSVNPWRLIRPYMRAPLPVNRFLMVFSGA